MTRIVRSNADEVTDRIKKWGDNAGKVIKGVLGSFAKDEEDRLKGTPYPSQRPGQDYNRTRALAAGWQVETNGFEVGVRNQTPHAHWAVDEKSQPWFHAGRWWVAQDVVQEHAFEFLPEEIAEDLIDSYD